MFFTPAQTQRTGQQRQPRQTARDQEWQVIPERGFVLGVALGKTLNVFNPEEVAPEIGFTLGNRQPPGQDNKHAAQDRKPAKNQHLFPALLGNYPRQDAKDRHHQGEKAFGHHPHTAGQPQHDVAPRFASQGLRLRGQPETAHRRRQPQGDDGVEHGIGANAIDQKQRQEDKAGEQGNAFIAPELPGHPDNQ